MYLRTFESDESLKGKRAGCFVLRNKTYEETGDRKNQQQHLSRFGTLGGLGVLSIELFSRNSSSDST